MQGACEGTPTPKSRKKPAKRDAPVGRIRPAVDVGDRSFAELVSRVRLRKTAPRFVSLALDL